MRWQKNRIWIGAIALVVLAGLAIWAVQRSARDTPKIESRSGLDFPDLERDEIAAIEITRPGDETQMVRLERRDGTWRITHPLDVAADQSAVSTAVDKLAEMEVVSVASSNPQFHERLEVDRAHGLRVVVRNAQGDVRADLWIGAYRSGNTMVRVEGQDRVMAVRGSIKFAFNRDLRDWRDRAVVDVDPEQVREVAWTSPGKTFRFVRPVVEREGTGSGENEGPQTRETELGDWQMAEVSFTPPVTETPDAGPRRNRPAPPPSPATTIENFAPSKVRTMVSSLARMRATDFAAADVTPESAGIGPDSPRVTLTVGEGNERRTYTVILGREAHAEQHTYYAMREGNDTIYVISQFLSQRVNPDASAFQQVPATSSASSATTGGAGGGSPTSGNSSSTGASAGTRSDSSGGSSSSTEPPTIPPEVIEELRRQVEGAGGEP